jgi:hypothetical protein
MVATAGVANISATLPEGMKKIDLDLPLEGSRREFGLESLWIPFTTKEILRTGLPVWKCKGLANNQPPDHHEKTLFRGISLPEKPPVIGASSIMRNFPPMVEIQPVVRLEG